VAGEKEMSPARSCMAGRSDVVCWSFWRFLLRSREIGDKLLVVCRTAELRLSSTCSAGVAGVDLALLAICCWRIDLSLIGDASGIDFWRRWHSWTTPAVCAGSIPGDGAAGRRRQQARDQFLEMA